MSNFSALDPNHVARLLDPFAPGMAQHITPIKYEALTPDLFMFLFRTTAPDNTEHFFVSVESDHFSGVEGVRCTIEDWHGNDVLEFLDEENLHHPTSGPYKAVLARVGKPKGNGYWSSSTLIMPGDVIGEKIKDYTPKEQDNIRKTLKKILRHKVDETMPFAESVVAKTKDTIVDDVNMTQMSVKLFVKNEDEIECFYNYVTPTAGGRSVPPAE